MSSTNFTCSILEYLDSYKTQRFAERVNGLKPLNYFLKRPSLNRFSSSINRSNQSGINSFIEAVVRLFSFKKVFLKMRKIYTKIQPNMSLAQMFSCEFSEIFTIIYERLVLVLVIFFIWIKKMKYHCKFVSLKPQHTVPGLNI